MKYSGLIFTSLALSCSIATAASEATFSGNTLHIPHVMYKKAMYDVTMKFEAPNKLTLIDAKPITSVPENPAVEVSDKLGFKIIDITVGDLVYRADIAVVKGSTSKFTASTVGPAIHGKMLKGEKISALGYLADGSFSYAYSISPDGTQITGRSRNAKRKTVAIQFHFDDGHIHAIKGLSGGNDIGRSINNSGHIAGYGKLKVEKDKPSIYNAFYGENGKELVSIGTLGEGIDSRAYGINQTNTIVGWSATKADNSDHVAFSYDVKTAKMTSLGADILGGTRSFAFAINDSDQIAGVALTKDSSAVAFVYQNGKATNLGSLDDSGYSEARAINDKGETAGWSLTADGSYQAFIHDGKEMKRLKGLGGDTKAYGINTHGHVVGDARDEKGDRHAFIFKDGKMVSLYSLLPDADKANWKELREAFSISDDGVIVGRGRYWKDDAKKKDTSMGFRIKL